MTFEEWWAARMGQGENPYTRPLCHDAWDASRTQALYDTSVRSGDAANEAEKAQRLEVAISKLSARYPTKDEAEYLREVIAEAQG